MLVVARELGWPLVQATEQGSLRGDATGRGREGVAAEDGDQGSIRGFDGVRGVVQGLVGGGEAPFLLSPGADTCQISGGGWPARRWVYPWNATVIQG